MTRGRANLPLVALLACAVPPGPTLPAAPAPKMTTSKLSMRRPSLQPYYPQPAGSRAFLAKSLLQPPTAFAKHRASWGVAKR